MHWVLRPSGFPPGLVFNSVSYNKQTWGWRQWFLPHRHVNDFWILSGGDEMDFPTPPNGRAYFKHYIWLDSDWTVTGLASISKFISAFLTSNYGFLKVFLLRSFNTLPDPSLTDELNKIFWRVFILHLHTSADCHYF